MTYVSPELALIDRDLARCRRFERLANQLDIHFRTFTALPPKRAPNHDRVRVVVQSLEFAPPTLAQVRTVFPRARVLVNGTDTSQRAAIAAFRAGADDFVPDGADDGELEALLRRYLGSSPVESTDAAAAHGIVGESRALRSICHFAARIAPTNVTILLSGETGTGKDLLAAMIHRLSRRVDGPLVALNCAAIPEALLEGELFGYERGAFTGALNSYLGKLKLADGGTLLLDEIGELSLAGQAKVLRAIETGEAYRLGARMPTHFDVRIIAASNRDLPAETKAGRFREDLFYRLAVAQITVPPLRERIEDIAPIARRLCRDLAALAGRPAMRIADDAMARLQAHCWPGNVRELRNVIEIAMVTSDGDSIRVGDLPSYLGPGSPSGAIRADERALLLKTLERAGGNKSAAAKALNCSRMTLYRRLARHGLGGENAPRASHLSL